VAGRTWEDTQLWHELLGSNDEPAPKLRRLLEAVLPDVEEVLDGGGTIPLNFTLHDAEHSWRVAQWMAELAGEEVLSGMQPYDLATLLLSAYLHDIGMSPEGGKVEAYFDFLISGERTSPNSGEEVLSATEAEELQEWLDEEWDGRVPPLVEGRPSPDDNNLARKIAAYYVRHRHNDWSEPWIEKHVAPKAGELYSDWVADLVLLCRSHHFGIRELRDERFAPREVDSPATVLHLRYCACLLRLADVLDVDPERTPPILFEHRAVTGESAIHWRKHLRLSSRRVDDHIELKAEPEDAIAHHALDQTIADINRELALCRQLDDETDFQQLAGSDEPLPHRWTLELGVRAWVRPYENAYEYVDGTFRPDPQRLLELLGGIELYGSSSAAIRELLQNAFDAVREQIARQRLQKPEAAGTETLDRIAAKHEVSLVLEREGSGARLVCRDSGVGMSKDAITSRFLVGGTKASPGLLRLERACAEEGFAVGRTARFGIGVLSYFLLAKQLVVRTRPSKQSDDQDAPGWTFESYGLADFGELRETPHEEEGTEVELRIDPAVAGGDWEAFAAEVEDYVAETVRRTPCRFSFSAPDFGLDGFSFEAGWASREDDVRDALLAELQVRGDGDDEDTRPLPDAEQALELIVDEGELPDGLGTFRIFLGHFDFAAGQSLAFLRLRPDGAEHYLIEALGDPDGIQLPSTQKFSWNGIDVSADWDSEDWSRSWDDVDQPDDDIDELLESREEPLNSYVEIDLTSDEAGRIAVDRDYFTPTPVVVDALRLVDRRAAVLLAEFVDANRDSSLALVNAHLIDRFPVDLKRPPYWALEEVSSGRRERRVFGPVKLPTVCIGDPPDTIFRPTFTWRGEAAARAAGLNIADEQEFKRNHRSWFGRLYGPQFVGALKGDGGVRPVLVWEAFEPNELAAVDETRYPAKLAQFPPEWGSLAAISSGGDQNLLNVWNRGNPVCRAIDPVAWDWALATFAESADPATHEEDILRSPARVAAWILICLHEVGGDTWNAVADRSPGFVAEVWRAIDGLKEDDEILSLIQLDNKMEIQALNRSERRSEAQPRAKVEGLAFTQTLPVPSKDWLVTPIRGSRRRDGE